MVVRISLVLLALGEELPRLHEIVAVARHFLLYLVSVVCEKLFWVILLYRVSLVYLRKFNYRVLRPIPGIGTSSSALLLLRRKGQWVLR